MGVTKLIRSAFPNFHLRVSGSREAKRRKKDTRREKKKMFVTKTMKAFFCKFLHQLPSIVLQYLDCLLSKKRKKKKSSHPVSLQIEATISLIAVR